MKALMYVPREDVPWWKDAGWITTPILEGTHHGYHAVMMQWCGEGEPVVPDALNTKRTAATCETM